MSWILVSPTVVSVCAVLALAACETGNKTDQPAAPSASEPSVATKAAPANPTTHQKDPPMPADVTAFSLTTIDGKAQPLSELSGKVLLMVNVASECGYTRQYSGLQELHEAYAPKGLVVMGIPANEFGGQEPGSNEEIAQFCSSKFDVSFPMYEKIVVKGEGQHPLYSYLTGAKGQVTWNFNKFLVGKDGKVLERFESKVEPMSAELRAAIDQALTG